jgi:hypothetical protein
MLFIPAEMAFAYLQQLQGGVRAALANLIKARDLLPSKT